MVSMTSGSYTLRSSDIMSDYVKLKLLAESFLVTLNSQYELSVKLTHSKGAKLLRPNFKTNWLEFNSLLFYEEMYYYW